MTTTKALCIALLTTAAALHSESGYKLSGRYPLPGTGGWDYVSIDGDARRIYVSHATQVEVLDADSGKQVGTIPDTPGVHGIAIAPGHRGFTSNGKENKVSVFDTTTLTLIGKIDVGKGPDLLLLRARRFERLPRNIGGCLRRCRGDPDAAKRQDHGDR